jgi:sugar phosphate isomerase/epimerase
MPLTDRRQFLRGAAGACLATASAAPAIEPIRRQGKSKLRLSIAAYSYRQYLDLKKKPQPDMTLDDFVDLSAELGVDAVEPTAYYFPQTTPEYLTRLKGHCTRMGLDVSGSACGNNFCHTDPEKLKQQIAYVKEWTEHTARLGGKTLRIFAGNLEKGDTEEVARKRVVAAIQEACDHAAKFGVYLALENHGGITATADQTLALVKAVNHDWFGMNFDTGNFHTPDPYADLVRIAPYAAVCQIKTEIQRAGKPKEEADLKRLTDTLRDAGFRGYVALEYEAAEDPKTGVPKAVEALRKLDGLRPLLPAGSVRPGELPLLGGSAQANPILVIATGFIHDDVAGLATASQRIIRRGEVVSHHALARLRRVEDRAGAVVQQRMPDEHVALAGTELGLAQPLLAHAPPHVRIERLFLRTVQGQCPGVEDVGRKAIAARDVAERSGFRSDVFQGEPGSHHAVGNDRRHEKGVHVHWPLAAPLEVERRQDAGVAVQQQTQHRGQALVQHQTAHHFLPVVEIVDLVGTSAGLHRHVLEQPEGGRKDVDEVVDVDRSLLAGAALPQAIDPFTDGVDLRRAEEPRQVQITLRPTPPPFLCPFGPGLL